MSLTSVRFSLWIHSPHYLLYEAGASPGPVISQMFLDSLGHHGLFGTHICLLPSRSGGSWGSLPDCPPFAGHYNSKQGIVTQIWQMILVSWGHPGKRTKVLDVPCYLSFPVPHLTHKKPLYIYPHSPTHCTSQMWTLLNVSSVLLSHCITPTQPTSVSPNETCCVTFPGYCTFSCHLQSNYLCKNIKHVPFNSQFKLFRVSHCKIRKKHYPR